MSTDEPEYLDSRGGVPGAPTDPRSPGGGRRTAWVAGGAVAALAVLGGAAWAAVAFFSTGAQPAEALPGSTIAYASIDLDPSGGQKIEALRTLKKFPAFEDHVGIGADDDVREWLVDKLVDETGCDDLDYADDVEPWLGDRFAVAAVDTGGDEPTPVLVLQVTDDDGADDGLATLRDCAGAGDEDVAWSVGDGWALLGETQDTVDEIASDAANAPLSDDDDFTHWADEAGDSGIASFYAAPALGDFIAERLSDLGADDLGDLGADGLGVTTDGQVPPEARAAFADFSGAAATIRFDDGGLELEVAGAGSAGSDDARVTDAGAAITSLPDDTVAALGLGFYDGWATDLLGSLSEGSGTDLDALVDQIEQGTGLALPDDIETLAGDSLTLAIGAGFDPSGLSFGSEGGSGPEQVGVKILGDADAIESVLDKVRGLEDVGGVLDSDAGDGVVVVGPDADYRAELLEDGGLGDSDTFRRVVEHADGASAILFLDLDGADEWLADLAEDDEVRANLAPLDALGMSAWLDGGVSHAVLKITTD